jgi:hypothetical protein
VCGVQAPGFACPFGCQQSIQTKTDGNDMNVTQLKNLARATALARINSRRFCDDCAELIRAILSLPEPK